MARKLPPIDKRFPVNRPPKPHTQKHPNGYLTPILKKLLNKEMKVEDVEVQKVFDLKPGNRKAKLKRIVMLRYILNAIQGENPAIEGILNRLDGKVKDKTELSVDEGIKDLLSKALGRLAKSNG